MCPSAGFVATSFLNRQKEAEQTACNWGRNGQLLHSLPAAATGGPSGWPGYAVAYPKPALLFVMTSLTGINKI